MKDESFREQFDKVAKELNDQRRNRMLTRVLEILQGAVQEMQDNGKIIITPLAFIRGRSLSNILFIVDEAQNLTPHEVKTIITRAGENTKIIFTGDVHQIDSPYLDENSNGLAYLIDRLKNQELFTNVKLEKGERSELANLANDLL